MIQECSKVSIEDPSSSWGDTVLRIIQNIGILFGNWADKIGGWLRRLVEALASGLQRGLQIRSERELVSTRV